MKNNKTKEHESDDDEVELKQDSPNANKVAVNVAPTQAQIEAQQLARMPTMPDSEISPAAHIFQHPQ